MDTVVCFIKNVSFRILDVLIFENLKKLNAFVAVVSSVKNTGHEDSVIFVPGDEFGSGQIYQPKKENMAENNG